MSGAWPRRGERGRALGGVLLRCRTLAIAIFAHLRDATGEAHARLEAGLDLLRPPLERARFVRVLARFHGVHAAWEPALARRPEFGALMAERSRLPRLAHDLGRLGLSPGEIAALPVCTAAASLTQSFEGAWGSLYVMEGSTLGGRVIARALADAEWLPEGGLSYFDAHGAETGRRWRDLAAMMEESVAPDAWPAVAAGAARTFALLEAWMAEAPG